MSGAWRAHGWETRTGGGSATPIQPSSAAIHDTEIGQRAFRFGYAAMGWDPRTLRENVQFFRDRHKIAQMS